MTYEQTIAYLYEKLPVFHRIGKVAFKANLNNTIALCEHLDNPHQKFKSIHVAGTNGKGSTSHYLAAILQSAGYKTGLYTSPHLKSYTERIRINGEPIPENKVVDFVKDNQNIIESLAPSFFELSVGMAFDYFAKEAVDIAIIEVGLGGRLDSTNIIIPLISVITNISFDHTDILGDTLPKIANEKAGIIKKQVPVVISERNPETETVFMDKAKQENAPIYFASDEYKFNGFELNENSIDLEIIRIQDKYPFEINSQLMGNYQSKNIIGVLKAVDLLINSGYLIHPKNIEDGFSKVVDLTGLKGRWQTLSHSPKIICDTAHNVAGILQVLENLRMSKYHQLWMILGFVSDKDISSILSLLPKEANYIFCQANIPRALPATELLKKAKDFGLIGVVVDDVNEAIDYAILNANKADIIYVGGSTFVVAEIKNL
jgi:dihydrofolate synthase / folylpolyglutamate synthase